MSARDCLKCGAAFIARQNRTKFCSIRCAKLYHYEHNTPDPKTLLLSRMRIDNLTGCWNWTGGVRNKQFAYGRLNYRGQSWPAHRLSFQVFRGDVPADMMVCHRCDNPLCINPGHLFLGSALDNASDMHAKGRHPHGERHGNAKLTSEQVQEIRALYESGHKFTTS